MTISCHLENTNPHKKNHTQYQPTECQKGKGPTIYAILTKQPRQGRVSDEQPNNTTTNCSTRSCVFEVKAYKPVNVRSAEANDKHIVEQAQETKRQQHKQMIEREQA